MPGKARGPLAGRSEDSSYSSSPLSSFGGWWRKIEYVFLWMAPVLLTAECCWQKHAVSLRERCSFCKGQEADLLMKNHTENRELHINLA